MAILETEKTQGISTPTLTVKDNIIEFQNYFIQISNISEAELVPIPKLPYPIFAIVLILVGLLMFAVGIIGSALGVILGIILFAVGAIWMYKRYHENQNRGEVLLLGLNSGKRFYFKCHDKEFLRQVLDVLKSCINIKGQNVTFDFTKSVITNSPITIGNNNNAEVNV